MSKKLDRNESYWTRKLVDYLRENHPKFLRLKLADHFTHGIPDNAIIGNMLTLWLELKVLQPKETIVHRVYKDELQLHTMHQIEELVGGAFYMIFQPGMEMRYQILFPSWIVRAGRLGGELPEDLPVYLDFSWVSNYFEEGNYHEIQD